MKKAIRNTILLLLPFVTILLLNESVRLSTTQSQTKVNGIITINPSQKTKDKCTWACYYDTGYCKENHVKLLRNYFQYIDPVYFGVIHSLKSTGNYSLANVIVLVLVIPILIFLLLFKILDFQMEIKVLKSRS